MTATTPGTLRPLEIHGGVAEMPGPLTTWWRRAARQEPGAAGGPSWWGIGYSAPHHSQCVTC